MRGGQGKARGDGAKQEGTGQHERDDLAPKRQWEWGQCAVPETLRHKGRSPCRLGIPEHHSPTWHIYTD